MRQGYPVEANGDYGDYGENGDHGDYGVIEDQSRHSWLTLFP